MTIWMLLLPAVLLAAMPRAGTGEESPASPAQPAAEAQPAAAEKAAAAAAAAPDQAAAKTGEEAFTPPPGWLPKKRGKFIVYCRKQSQMGSRVPTETCYDETGIREMLRAQQEDREKVDQMRRICGSMDACGGGG
jgi:hypothetical protein